MRTCETPTRISSSAEAVLARERDEALHAEPTSATDTIVRPASSQMIRRRTSSRTVSRAMTIIGRLRTGSRAAASADELEEARLERAATGLDGMDPAAGRDDRGDEVGDPVGASGRKVSHSPSSSSGPSRASAARAGPSRSVTRIRTPSPATTSSSEPAATTRPWSTMTTRSQTRSTSVSRCELRMTVAPRSRAARTISRTSVRPTGSSAEVGSSSRTRSGVAEERDAEAEPLLHALGEAADRVVGPAGQVDVGERLGRRGRLARRPAARRARRGASRTSRARSHGW